jgi:hypothetical protein
MTTNITGTADNCVPTGAPVNIASSTNATPIQITTSAPHLLNEGDVIVVANHETNTNANGMWFAHVNGASTVVLWNLATVPGGGRPNSVGNGVGGATGTVQSQCFTPDQFQAPSSGETVTASSVQTIANALADRTNRVSMLASKYQLIAINGAGGSGADPPTTLTSSWHTNAYSSPFQVYGLSGLALIPGDLIIARMSVGLFMPTNNTTISVKAQLTITTPTPTTTYTGDFTNQGLIYATATPTYSVSGMHPLLCSYILTPGITGSIVNVFLTGKTADNASAPNLLSNTSVEISVWRQPTL